MNELAAFIVEILTELKYITMSRDQEAVWVSNKTLFVYALNATRDCTAARERSEISVGNTYKGTTPAIQRRI